MTLQFSTRNFVKKKKNPCPMTPPSPLKLNNIPLRPYYTNYEIMTFNIVYQGLT